MFIPDYAVLGVLWISTKKKLGCSKKMYCFQTASVQTYSQTVCPRGNGEMNICFKPFPVQRFLCLSISSVV